MVGWILRLILIILIVRAVVRLAQGLIEGIRVPVGRGGRQASAVRLVKDPVCGTYVVKARALTSGSGDDVHYFCSERCRDAYVRPAPSRPASEAGRPKRVEGSERTGRRSA
jgi:YHS domain-containing protein